MTHFDFACLDKVETSAGTIGKKLTNGSVEIKKIQTAQQFLTIDDCTIFLRGYTNINMEGKLLLIVQRSSKFSILIVMNNPYFSGCSSCKL